MFIRFCLMLVMCNICNGSVTKREDIDIRPIRHEDIQFDVKKEYNEQHRERLPESALIHSASTSIVSQRTDRGSMDLPGVVRVISDDSNTINVAATIAVRTDAECCNSRCCIEEDHTCKCCMQ